MLEPVGIGAFRIQWHHPEFGKGCLKVLESGLLEPWDDCSKASQFLIEAKDGQYALRVDGRGCIGIEGAGERAEALVKDCGQTFLIEAV